MGGQVKTVVFAQGGMGIMGIRRLLQGGFTIDLLVSDRDQPGCAVDMVSVEDLARELSIPCVFPTNPNQFGWMEKIKDLKPGMVFSLGYRRELKRQLLAIPAHGAFAVHESYLPRYRGPCPVSWAIIKGETSTGVTLFEMTDQPYAGPVLVQRRVDIAPLDTARTLTDRLVHEADTMLAGILPGMKSLDIPRTPQDPSQASTFGELTPEDGRISWEKPALELFDLVRACSLPHSGAFGLLGDDMVFFRWALPVQDVHHEPGAIVTSGETVLVGTGYGCLRPEEVEVNGRTLKGSSLVRFFHEHRTEVMQ